MLQTWWDLNQQIVRKVIDGIAGAVAGWLIAQGEWGALLAPGVAILVNFAWFWISNRKKVTVKGLQEAGTFTAVEAATAVKGAILAEEGKK